MRIRACSCKGAGEALPPDRWSIFLTEVTRSTARTTACLPIADDVAVGTGADPPLLRVPGCLEDFPVPDRLIRVTANQSFDQLLVVPYDLPLNEIDHLFGDVRCHVPDAFQLPRDIFKP